MKKSQWQFVILISIIIFCTTSCKKEEKNKGPILKKENANFKNDAPSNPLKISGLSLYIEVPESIAIGKPIRIRGFAVNHDNEPKKIKGEWLQIVIQGPKRKMVLGRDYFYINHGQNAVEVPPKKKVTCFDIMIPTGMRWSSNTILIRGEARISWKVWVNKGEHPISGTVKSKAFKMRLDNAVKKKNDFAVKGLLVEIEAVNKEVTSRKQVRFIVKLKNISKKRIRISGREKFNDNVCYFLIYAPGEKWPVIEGVEWPTKGTKGFIMRRSKTVAREFTADWGVASDLITGEECYEERVETTFLKKGAYKIIAYFRGEDVTEKQNCWTGYARSNVVTINQKERDKK